MIILAKTNHGIEDLASGEIEDKLGCKTIGVRPARVMVECGSIDKIRNSVSLLRMVHGLYIVLLHTSISLDDTGLEEARAYARGIDWSRFIPFSSSFAVRGERVGSGHSYTSMKLAAVVGDEIYKQLSGKGWEVEVNLNTPTIVVAAEVVYNEFFLMIQLYGEQSYHRRWYRIYEHQASLKPSLAYAMLSIGGVHDGAVLLDPVCGSGTIPIEAALEHEDITIYCSDSSPKSIMMARANAAIARVQNRIRFFVSKAIELDKIIEDKVTHIIGNPPYGLRIGSVKKARETVEEVILVAEKILVDDGRLVLISPDKNFIKNKALERGFSFYEERKVKHGDLYVWIMGFYKK